MGNQETFCTLKDVILLPLSSHTSIAVTGQGKPASGALVVAENGKQIPWAMERIFFVYGLNANDLRGEHAHRKCKQILIAIQGTIEVRCTDGIDEKTYLLDSPDKAILIPQSIWASQRYIQRESILLVLTDQRFSEADYIREYDDYLRYRKASL